MQQSTLQCSYLGHIVGNGVVLPELDKVEAVRSFGIPQTNTDVRIFLGLMGYYTRFISDVLLLLSYS